MNCIHYDIDRKCAAFPDGIPDEIWEGENDHTEPLPEQGNELVFTPLSENA